VVHRDLKLENLLFVRNPEFDEDLNVKVIDFGIAGVADGGKIDAGSLAYMPPECFGPTAAETSLSIDIWAIGIMFYAMLYGTLPFFHKVEDKLIDAIVNQPLKFDPKVPVSDEAKDIMTMMIMKDPTKRVTLNKVMEMNYYYMDEDAADKLMETTKINHEQKLAQKEE